MLLLRHDDTPKGGFYVRVLFLLIFLYYCTSLTLAFRKQGVTARGVVRCGNQPAAGVRVRLYDLDRNPGDTDDLMAEAYSDRNGLFFLDGTTRELTNIEPQIRIYHDCADGIKECQRVRVIDVPGDYIYTDDNNKRVYNMGVVDLIAVLAASSATEPRICQGDL